MRKRAKNDGDSSVKSWFSGKKLQYLLIAAGIALVAYKIGRSRERSKMLARAAKPRKGTTLQAKMGMPMAPAPMRDNMGFSNIEADLSGLDNLACGNKPCAACAEQQCEYPSVAQADVPSEEFEFTT